MKAALVVMVVIAGAACGGATPVTRYYTLGMSGSGSGVKDGSGAGVLEVDSLAVDGAYDDARIVYRTDPYRLDYYEYHRWSATPGQMIGAFLARSLASSGDFRAVVREPTRDTMAVLGGRVVAIEEVDTGPKQWLGRIALELTLTDSKTGEVVWSKVIEDSEPLAVQSPEGLARAISVATTRIAARVAPEIAGVCSPRG